VDVESEVNELDGQVQLMEFDQATANLVLDQLHFDFGWAKAPAVTIPPPSDTDQNPPQEQPSTKVETQPEPAEQEVANQEVA